MKEQNFRNLWWSDSVKRVGEIAIPREKIGRARPEPVLSEVE
jgi:hypothetical protein